MERITNFGAVFETVHGGSTTMHHHRHTAPFVTIVLRGSYIEVRDAVPKVCHHGILVVHDAAEEHADRFAADTRCLNVELPPESTSYPRGNFERNAPDLRGAVEAVVQSFYGRTALLPAAVGRLQRALLARPLQPRADWPQWLHHVLDAFPWSEPRPLREAAGMADLHVTHFSRAFRRHIGMTAGAYRARARLELASKLLLTTAYPLARVALSAGFSDQSHLTRVLSDTLGLSPAGYRRTFAR